jgi:pimeloyl-ACP methyl ester carboxylesterase
MSGISATRALSRHLSLAALAVFLGGGHALAQAPALAANNVSYTVLMGGTRVGSQTVSLTKGENGWLLSSFGSLGAPFNIVTKKLEISYSGTWHPERLVLQGAVGGQAVSLTTTFGASTATNELVQGGQKAVNTQVISPQAVVLPDNFFGTYQALAARLENAQAGTTLPIYRVPEGEFAATVTRVTSRRLVTAEGPLAIREFVMTLATPQGGFPLEVWTDDRQRLARLVLPISSVVVIRDDLTSVMTREDHSPNPGDETVFIPANGFTIGATITRPPAGASRSPVAVLAAGPGNPGRDRMTGGVPVFGRLAGDLAAAGLFVVRYDSRGSGQTGGRTENAGLLAYRDDLLSVIQWLRRQRDVDAERILVVGYGDSGPVALLAAEREDRIKAIALLGAPGRSGRDAVLDQQERMLSRLPIPEAERARRIALQKQINDAAVTGKGWESISTDVRRQADTPWFRSWLLFDPAAVLEEIDQPILIVQGARDTEVSASDADRLEGLARNPDRRSASMTRKVIIPEVDHAFVPSPDQPSESMPAASISAEVGKAIAEWLRVAVPAR